MSEKFPVTVGRHLSNDIVVDEDGVATMHCRISWGKSKYQITAANSAGVVVNGVLTAQADLKEGDVVRVGSSQIRFSESNSPEDLEEDIPLKAHDEKESRVPAWETPSRKQADERPVGTKSPVENRTATERRGKKGHEDEPPPLQDSLAELFSDASSDDDGGFLPSGSSYADDDDGAESHQGGSGRAGTDSLAEILGDTPFEAREEAKTKGPPVINTPRDLFTPRKLRPQDRDAARSPLVLFLGGGTLVLLLAAGTLWFLINREGAAQMYGKALAEYDQKRYTSSIERFEEFLKSYPRHGMSKTARSYIGLARIEQTLVGAAPDWKRGLEQLDQYIRAERQKPSFPDWQTRVREIAEHIAFGSLETAVAAHDISQLDLSGSAAKVLELNSPLDTPPTEKLRKIHDATLAAEAEIRKYQVITKAYADIDAAVKESQTQQGLQLHRKLLDQYADAEQLPELKDRLKQVLAAEQKLIVRSEPGQPAKTEERPGHLASIRVARQTRARADLKASGINAFAMAEGTCLAIDSGSGAIQWDRQLGIQVPFAPVPVSIDVAALLAFDTRHQDLLMLRQKDGKLLWRQPLGEDILGPPLVHAGNVFVATNAGHLHQMDLASGKLLATLKFPQAIIGPPVLTAHDERLVVVGRERVIYVLNYRPLEGVGVIYTQHRSGSIQAPPTKMGSYVLIAEVDRKDSTKLSVWDFGRDLPQVAAAVDRVPGLVRDTPLLRGKLLCVPSSGQQVTVFSVSDEPGSPPLKRVAGYQVPRGGQGAIYLAAGPEDELWMAGQSVRRLRLTRDSIVPDERAVALGIATQPLRVIDQDLIAVGYVGSDSRATAVIAADRRQMLGLWQTVSAMAPRWVAPDANSTSKFHLLTDTGDMFEVAAPENSKGGFAPARLLTSLPGESARTGLKVCPVGTKRIFLAGARPKPHWWLVDQDGVQISEGDLAAPLEASPCAFATGVLLPMPGRLAFLDLQNPDRHVEEFLSPVEEQQKPPAWTSIAAISSTEALAITKTGRLSRFQLRSDPQPHLFEVTHLDLKSPVEFPPLVSEQRALVPTGKQLQWRQVETWEAEQTAELSGEISAAPWSVGGQVFVELEERTLSVLDGTTLKAIAEHKLDSPVAGTPVAWNGATIVPLQSGRVLKISADGKATVHEVDRNLAGDPLVLGKSLLLPAVDGSWLSLDALPEVKSP
ncbi:MAG: PQQ-binding-like beta-propeller repeat protein [Planctomycetales bacterium]